MSDSNGSEFTWTECSPEERAAIAIVLSRAAPTLLRTAPIVRARSARVPPLQRYRAYEIEIAGLDGVASVLHGGADDLLWLDGTAAPLYAALEREHVTLEADDVLDWVRLFLRFMRAGDAEFALLESPAALSGAGASDERLAELRALVGPAQALPVVPPDPRFRATGVIAYRGGLFRSTFAIEPNGAIEMVDDTPLGMLEGVGVASLPKLAADPRGREPGPRAPDGGEAARARGDAPVDEADDDREPEPDAARLRTEAAVARAATAPTHANDHQITAAVVSVLLAKAVTQAMSHLLLQRFNTESQPDGPLGQLARFVDAFAPVVIVESEIPFVETIVAQLVAPDVRMERAPAMRELSDDLRCVVDADASSASLILLSFHAYRRIWDPEWTAHRLALGTAAVLVGCDRRTDVPEPLRRVADLVLTLPRIDATLFPAIFAKVCGVPPPHDWQRGGADWVRYLLHSDFHAPARLSLSPAESVEYLRAQCRARLEQVSAADSPALEDLHGLGEARQIAEDLIADIAAARVGTIPWSAVDRGLLLAGPPGTGKTTLGRAIARASGIKFVIGSAAQWQASGGLDSHLRAIRETFAEARRYAPAMLFIDEIDSIGNRETFSGNNAIYQTEVVNALLEQMQGMSEDEPVIVIAATNHVDKVDPALRRAGRLDQVVNIPRPNVAGLAQIFDYHLRGLRAQKRVARGVNVRALARLAFGCTGADVEFFVRGAARRARKASRKVEQDDLLAEVTRRPRHPDGVLRLSEDDMRRVAVHEAGHAVALLATPGAAENVAFVSIVPRSNGTLGFVAHANVGGVVVTREQVLAHLRVLLAGRAAEEIVYGRGGTSLGAGLGASSDLAVATRVATELVCSAGLGDDGGLHWTETPTRSQARQIDLLLRRAQREVIDLLRARRATLERVADLLIEEQEIEGAALRRLVREDSRPRKSRARATPGKRRKAPAVAAEKPGRKPRARRRG